MHSFIDSAATALSGLSSAKILGRGIFRISTPHPGPRALIMCGVHGDEQNPVHALLAFIDELLAGKAAVSRGSLTLIIANEAALLRNVRYIEKNLNRLFRDAASPSSSAEELRAEELKPFLADCEYLLDLHSTSGDSPPFLMCEKHLITSARALGLPHIVTGWGELGDASTAGDTENYALLHGAVAFTMENGQHTWEGGKASALSTIHRFIRFCGIGTAPAETASPETAHYHLFYTHARRGSEFSYTRPFRTFDRIRKGERICSDSGQEFSAPEDCVIIMPGPADGRKIGEDQFLLARICPQ